MTDSLEKKVLVLPLEEAVSVLVKAGLLVEIQETAPPRGGNVGGEERVIRLQIKGQTGIVTVAREQILN